MNRFCLGPWLLKGAVLKKEGGGGGSSLTIVDLPRLPTVNTHLLEQQPTINTTPHHNKQQRQRRQLLVAALLPLAFTLLGDIAELYFSPIMAHVSQSVPKMRPRFAGGARPSACLPARCSSVLPPLTAICSAVRCRLGRSIPFWLLHLGRCSQQHTGSPPHKTNTTHLNQTRARSHLCRARQRRAGPQRQRRRHPGGRGRAQRRRHHRRGDVCAVRRRRRGACAPYQRVVAVFHPLLACISSQITLNSRTCCIALPPNNTTPTKRNHHTTTHHHNTTIITTTSNSSSRCRPTA